MQSRKSTYIRALFSSFFMLPPALPQDPLIQEETCEPHQIRYYEYHNQIR